jgi:SAM-dependent methyltransferase
VTPSFLQLYLESFHSIEGWFDFDAALLFMAYNQLLAKQGVTGDVLEIGSYHGLSTIAVATLRGPGAKLFAVDLFEDLQALNVSGSGMGSSRTMFEKNMRKFHPDLGFLRVVAKPSSDVKAAELGTSFSFCHIDGGHSPAETCHDLKLCHELLLPGGLVALDDYFNPAFPGVGEGALEFRREHPGALQPIAIGYNKVLFQKGTSPASLNTEFRRSYPLPDLTEARMWDAPALLLPSPLRFLLDLHASTPRSLVRLGAAGVRVRFAPAVSSLHASAGDRLSLGVTITNRSQEPLPAGEHVCGLSYHLLGEEGKTLQHDNERAWLLTPLDPGQERRLELRIAAPALKGKFKIEIDLVWEGVMWFKDVGNPTRMVDVIVT